MKKIDEIEVADVSLGHGKIGLATLWAIGTGTVLGGDFYGWQYVDYGGIISGVIALLFTAIFYWLYSGVVTELAARYRTSGGSFDYVQNVLGVRAASIMGILTCFKLCFTISSLSVSVSSYVVAAGLPHHLIYICWLAIYSIFTFLDCNGVHESSTGQVLATVVCVLVLIFYSLSSFSMFDWRVAVSDGVFIEGGLGFLKALPFTLYLFEGFEELPLVMCHAIDPQINLPKSILYSYFTVTMLAFLVFISGCGTASQSSLLSSPTPLMISINHIYGTGSHISYFTAVLIVIGLLVNVFAYVVLLSQQVVAIADHKLFPEYLSYRHPSHHAPVTASVSCSVIGFFLCVSFTITFGVTAAQLALITASLIPTVLGFLLMLQCLVRIRDIEFEQMSCKLIDRFQQDQLGFDPGPLRYPYGILGARIAQCMCILLLGCLLLQCYLYIENFYGLLIIIMFGLSLYAVMWNRINYLETECVVPSKIHLADSHGKGSYGPVPAL